MKRQESYNIQDTLHIGESASQQLQGGDIVLLHGDLGAGKTTFVKGLAKGLGIEANIVSPTFTIMNVYDINHKNLKSLNHKSIKTLVHVDTYRLEDEEELVKIGIEDYLGQPDTICIIEWPEKIPNLLKDKKMKNIYLSHTKNENRVISFDY